MTVTALTEAAIYDALRSVQEPELERWFPLWGIPI